MRSGSPLLPALCLCLLLSACSRSTTLDATRYETAPEAPYSGILVIGLSNNLNRRDRWETVMADTLRRGGATAWASTSRMDSTTDLNRDSVGALVAELDAELVLVTRLVSQDVTATEVEARTGVKTRRRSDTPVVDFFRYDYTEYEEPGYVLLTSTVRLTTDIYETRQGRLIHSIDTVTRDQDSEFELLVEVTEAIESELRRAGLIGGRS